MVPGKTKLSHPIAGVGLLVEVIVNTPHGPKYVIKLSNGRQYFAPINEFTILK